MFAKQLTVFVENRKGRLCDVLDVLKTNKVNILSLSLADTTEFGLLRLIVDNPALGVGYAIAMMFIYYIYVLWFCWKGSKIGLK